jgi:hypothetical protein
LARCQEIKNPTRGVFVLALQQVVDSFIACLLSDEALNGWHQKNSEQIRFWLRASTSGICSEYACHLSKLNEVQPL